MLRHKAGIRTWPSLPERFKGPSGPSRSLAKKDSAKGKLHQEPKMNSGAVTVMHGSRNEQSVVNALGKQRMEKYLSQMGNHAGRALQLYKWDAELSGAMWNLLSIFEVVLRNKICEAVDEWSEEQRPQSNKQWIRHPRVNVREPLSKVAASVAKDALRKALEAKKLRDEGDGLFIGNHPRKGQSITRDDVVAQVTLTQWKNNFFYRDPEELPDGSYKFYPNETNYNDCKRVYEEITVRALSSGPKSISPDRASLIMNHVVLLRNRIGHQESLIDIDCRRYRKEIFELLNCLSPAVLENYSANDPIPRILNNDPRRGNRSSRD